MLLPFINVRVETGTLGNTRTGKDEDVVRLLTMSSFLVGPPFFTFVSLQFFAVSCLPACLPVCPSKDFSKRVMGAGDASAFNIFSAHLMTR